MSALSPISGTLVVIIKEGSESCGANGNMPAHGRVQLCSCARSQMVAENRPMVGNVRCSVCT